MIFAHTWACLVNWINQTTCRWPHPKKKSRCSPFSPRTATPANCPHCRHHRRRCSGSVFLRPTVNWNARIPWCSCCASWPRRRRRYRQTDRQMEVGMEGRLKKGRRLGLVGLFPRQPVVCGYCAITVGLVWVLYYCTIWRIVIYCVQKEHFPPHLYYIRY